MRKHHSSTRCLVHGRTLPVNTQDEAHLLAHVVDLLPLDLVGLAALVDLIFEGQGDRLDFQGGSRQARKVEYWFRTHSAPSDNANTPVSYLLDDAAVPPRVSSVAFPALDEYSCSQGRGMTETPRWRVTLTE